MEPRREWERLLRREWDESKHPRVPAGSPEGGEFGFGGGGDGGDGGGDKKPSTKVGASKYGLVPSDVEKFEALKLEKAAINNELGRRDNLRDPGGAESTRLLSRMTEISKEINRLHADPGTAEGIYKPGGPRDTFIVGTGPGGLAAAVSGAAEGLDTGAVEAQLVAGGQAKYSSRIENYLGFPIGVSGQQLTQSGLEQAERLGAEVTLGVRVTGMTIDDDGEMKHVTLSNGKTIDTRTVIIGGGIEFRKVTFPGAEGPGVILGSAEQLAAESKGKTAVVVGGSNGASQAALLCAEECDHVFVLSRSPITHGMSAYQQNALKANPKITVIEGDEIKELERDEKGQPKAVKTKNGQTLAIAAVGVFAGGVPNTKWVPAEASRDYKTKNPDNARLRTNGNLEVIDELGDPIPGVFAVGDMRDGTTGRIGIAAAEGMIAIRHAQDYLEKIRAAAGLAPKEDKADAPKKTPKKKLPDQWIDDVFDLDHANPWFGQTVDDQPPLEPKNKSKASSNSKRAWERAMPMNPRKDESQSDFMSRCVPDLMGDGKRENDQAVAACMQIWRDKDKDKDKAVAKNDDEALTPDDADDYEDWMYECEYNQDRDESDCQQEWEESRAGKAERTRARAAGTVIHKTHVADVTEEKEFILSDESLDRMGDQIMSTGWDVGNFKNNPIALFNHNPNFIVGRWVNVRVDDKRLRAKLVLAPAGASKRIDEIRALVDAGILKATSVGFKPLDFELLDKKNPFSGARFTKQELVETSLVSVPANANALAVAKSLKISSETTDMVFAKHGNRDRVVRRSLTAKHGKTSSNGKGTAMSLAQRITDLQTYISSKAEELNAHLANQDDSNVKDADVQKTNDLNGQITGARKQHAALVEAEKNVAGTADSGSVVIDGRTRSLQVTTGLTQDGSDRRSALGSPIILKPTKKDWSSLDLVVHAGVITTAAKIWNVPQEAARLKIYGEDEATKVVHEWFTRAASAPAMTTVTGWAAELVQQVYTDMMALLMPKSVYPRLAAKGLSLSFGRAGKIIVPSRSRTPTLAGSFVGEGMAIPVRQGAFVSLSYVPKKMAVITVWTKEMDEHSIPAIEGVLREAVQEDTAVAIDSVLLDAGAATTIRPAGLLNGVAALTATTGGGVNAIIGDIKALVGALTTSTLGNLRQLVWLMNPVDLLSLSLAYAPNTGTFPFKEEIARGTLGGIPIIDSSTVPPKTMVLLDAADFVTMTGDSMRFEISDQATLHMEDTAPLDLVSGSPGTAASPQRSLFQTDSLALRMILPMNWGLRRTGMVAWTSAITW